MVPSAGVVAPVVRRGAFTAAVHVGVVSRDDAVSSVPLEALTGVIVARTLSPGV